MRIAVLNEISGAVRNGDIIDALEGRGYEILNIGMKKPDQEHKLFYTHTGLLTALLLNLGRADFVVGGCGTGQGFFLSAMQYPGVFCGHILNPLDSWLFAQINAGNAVSLALNQGYGWAGEANLRFIFDRLFEVVPGSGFPKDRVKIQTELREKLVDISAAVHKPLHEIVACLDDDVVITALNFPGIPEILDIGNIKDEALRKALSLRIK